MPGVAGRRRTEKLLVSRSPTRNENGLGLRLPEAPTWRRYKTNHATIAKINAILSTNLRGILLCRDELVGFFATLDKEGNEADRAFFLEAWNGYGSRTDDLIGRGTIHTPNLCMSLFGGIQPDRIMGYMYRAMRGAENDGFMQRMQVLVYPDEPRDMEARRSEAQRSSS